MAPWRQVRRSFTSPAKITMMSTMESRRPNPKLINTVAITGLRISAIFDSKSDGLLWKKYKLNSHLNTFFATISITSHTNTVKMACTAASTAITGNVRAVTIRLVIEHNF